ncbi:response regulator transcription factor [Phytohabitans houttuyneae]|uniref:DNA-binding response regulator n=1 Tax=Phytohabitans houttuyneae TaxID=1076126 RepID=A0A6V8K8V0_9ACTN|nr:response regulator transcription factor [Phytohabitans houttuyneae]GFJ78197.1 DNA-binding response regulator [Phytohabitans houttuyneae]
MRLLVVEDEEDLAEAVRLGLVRAGYAVDVAGDAAQAYDRLAVNAYDLMLLDINLPDADGFGVCHAIRRGEVPVEGGADLRVLMLTARGALHDRVRGLDEGADDYLVKPFALAELLARVRALLRRDTGGGTAVLEVGGIRLDVARHEASVAGEALHLTPKEFGVLEYLMTRPGHVVPAEELLEHVWDENADPFTQTVRVTVGTLRRKLGGDAIETVVGRGYRLKES